MNEINRLQQLAGILTEIKVNNPIISKQDVLDLYQKKYLSMSDEELDKFWLGIDNKGIGIQDYMGDDDYDPIPEYNYFLYNYLKNI